MRACRITSLATTLFFLLSIHSSGKAGWFGPDEIQYSDVPPGKVVAKLICDESLLNMLSSSSSDDTYNLWLYVYNGFEDRVIVGVKYTFRGKLYFQSVTIASLAEGSTPLAFVFHNKNDCQIPLNSGIINSILVD